MLVFLPYRCDEEAGRGLQGPGRWWQGMNWKATDQTRSRSCPSKPASRSAYSEATSVFSLG